jgi:hypothetical protein
MVGQDNAGGPVAGRDGHLEWVSFRPIRDGACQRKAGFDVVNPGAYH